MMNYCNRVLHYLPCYKLHIEESHWTLNDAQSGVTLVHVLLTLLVPVANPGAGIGGMCPPLYANACIPLSASSCHFIHSYALCNATHCVCSRVPIHVIIKIHENRKHGKTKMFT